MFKPHYGICTCHGLNRLIVVRAGLCKQGNDERKRTPNDGGVKRPLPVPDKNRKQKNRSTTGRAVQTDNRRTGRNVSSLKRKPKKPTGELALFRKLYDERGPYSQVSGQWVDFSPWAFSHILSKGAYPSFRLYKKNIVIKTPEEHHLWETQRHKLRGLPEWEWIFELEQELIEEYYDKTKHARGGQPHKTL